MNITVIEKPNGEYFLSSKHWDRTYGRMFGNGTGALPCSFQLPMRVEPREGLEDGIVDDIEKLLIVFYTGENTIGNLYKRIANPVPELQA